MVWNIVDIGLLVILLLGVARGWQRGFLLGSLDLLVWIGSLLFGLRLYQPAANWLAPYLGLTEVWALPLAFLLIVVVASILINSFGYALLSPVSLRAHRRPTNRVLGMIPGFISGWISAAIVATLLLAVPLPSQVQTAARASPLTNRLAASTERVETALLPVFGDAIARTLNLLTVQPESDERLELPFTATDVQARPDLETEMLELLNGERAQVGLPPLAADPELTEVARQHSSDMLARGYFAHITPEGLSPFGRIDAAGITYRTAGENLALAPTLSIAHTGLMNSPGHRANILRPEFGRVGIGIIDGGQHGLMITQKFRD